MLKRGRIANFILLLGLLFVYSAVSGIAADAQQNYAYLQEQASEHNPFAGTEALSIPSATSMPTPTSGANPDELPEAPMPQQAGSTQAIAGETASSTPEPVTPDEIASLPAKPERPAEPEAPVRLVIPAIQLDAPVVMAETQIVKVSGSEYLQWKVPDEYAAGWHETSARLGEAGNTVLNGHHNRYGEVFVDLVDLEIGDRIQVYTEKSKYTYIVTNKMILPEKYEQLEVRMNNSQWILRSEDERLTLITCWPYESNTHRLIIVASPETYQRLTSEASGQDKLDLIK